MNAEQVIAEAAKLDGWALTYPEGLIRRPVEQCPISALQGRDAGEYVAVAQGLGIAPRTRESLAGAADGPRSAYQKKLRQQMLAAFGLQEG